MRYFLYFILGFIVQNHNVKITVFVIRKQGVLYLGYFWKKETVPFYIICTLEDRKYSYLNKYILAIFDITLWLFFTVECYPYYIIFYSLIISHYYIMLHKSDNFSISAPPTVAVPTPPPKKWKNINWKRKNQWTILLLHLSHLSNTSSFILLGFEAAMCPTLCTFVH